MLTINFAAQSDQTGDLSIFLVSQNDDETVKIHGMQHEAADANIVRETSLAAGFKPKAGKTVLLPGLDGVAARHTLLVGIGKIDTITTKDIYTAAGHAYTAAKRLPVASVNFYAPESILEISAASVACSIGYGLALKAYQFDKYKTKNRDELEIKFDTVNVLSSDAAGAKTQYDAYQAVASGVHTARNLQNEPGNVIYPETLAAAANAAVEPHGVKVTILDEAAMQKLGMNALLGVGQGSTAHPSRLVIMEYNGGGSEKPVGLVGKGVTFDTGGISIKPSNGMEDMKWDMGGSAVVTGTIQALAARKAKVNVVGVIGLVENMPDGDAQRPGDIVKSANGQTIEVLNTDAEGRLVLADALWYIQENYDPKFIIDYATLTGAVIVALGEITAGLMSNDDDLAAKLTAAAEETGEEIWRLPLKDEYDREIDSDVADMKNIGSGRGAGTITAAQFLQRFIDEDRPWAHLDIAGVTWSKKGNAFGPKGATGFGVRLTEQFIRENYEN